MTVPDFVAALCILVPLSGALIFGLYWEAKAMRARAAKEAALEKMYIAMAAKLLPELEVKED